MDPGRDWLVKPCYRNQGEYGDQEQTAQPQLEDARHTGSRIVISDRAGFYSVILVKARARRGYQFGSRTRPRPRRYGRRPILVTRHQCRDRTSEDESSVGWESSRPQEGRTATSWRLRDSVPNRRAWWGQKLR